MFLVLKDIVDFQKSFQDRLVILDAVGRGNGVATRISSNHFLIHFTN